MTPPSASLINLLHQFLFPLLLFLDNSLLVEIVVLGVLRLEKHAAGRWNHEVVGSAILGRQLLPLLRLVHDHIHERVLTHVVLVLLEIHIALRWVHPAEDLHLACLCCQAHFPIISLIAWLETIKKSFIFDSVVIILVVYRYVYMVHGNWLPVADVFGA